MRRAATPLGSLTLLALVTWMILLPPLPHGDTSATTPSHALWLGVEWVNEPRPSREIHALSERLKANRVGTVFAYTTYLRRDGTWSASRAHAPAFLRGMRRAAPGVRVEAWIGLPLKPPSWYRRAGHVVLADPAVRALVVAQARSLALDEGFDGVHVNAEPILNGDASVLSLLEEIRAAIGPRKSLSVTKPGEIPILRSAPGLSRMAWSDAYTREVAKRADAVAVMAYDSAMLTGGLYEAWMRLQVVNVTRALKGTKRHVWIGLPTYPNVTLAHRPRVENLDTALAGLLAGPRDPRAEPSVVRGAAIYAEWTTTPTDWATFERTWRTR